MHNTFGILRLGEGEVGGGGSKKYSRYCIKSNIIIIIQYILHLGRTHMVAERESEGVKGEKIFFQ